MWDALAAFGRWWYVWVVGIVLTGAALLLVDSQLPVYFSRAQVQFFSPSSELYPNVLRVSSLDLVAAAGVVGKRVNGTDTLTKTASMDATLVGRGVRDGSSVMLPDNGGQWSVSYDTQALDVQVVARTPEEVRTRQAALFKEIDDQLAALQEEFEVPAADLITTEVVPASPPIVLVTGDRRRAQLMTVLLGVTITFLVVGELERHRRRQLVRTI